MNVIRVLLVIFAMATASAAGYFLKQTDATLSNGGAVAESLRYQARTLTAEIAEMRTAQVAYVARGQGEDFWIARVAKLLPTVQQQLGDFDSKLTSPAAQASLEPALAAIENFQKLDRRAQEFVKGNNALLAADLIFSDGLEATTTATAQLDTALNQELQARQDTAAWHRNRQLEILGGSAGAVLLVMVILAFTGKPRMAEEPQAALTQQAEPVAEPKQAQADLMPVPAPVAAPVPVPSPDLSNAAQLCTDLARVFEPQQLPGLLERTARVLDASGLIVWVAEPAGNSLRAAMSFGYSDQFVARMGNIHRDANNAVAAAFRSGEMRTVNGGTSASSALVVPLLTSDGCIGALSAEVVGGTEKDERSQALAAILAAQLATIVAPPPAAAHVKATAHA
jgi:hypothetical protein